VAFEKRYEPPTTPEVRLETTKSPPEQLADKIVAYLMERNYVR
jgi:adenylylsulfate kinase-like enzyme